jgi:hypothetical protein
MKTIPTRCGAERVILFSSQVRAQTDCAVQPVWADQRSAPSAKPRGA